MVVMCIGHLDVAARRETQKCGFFCRPCAKYDESLPPACPRSVGSCRLGRLQGLVQLTFLNNEFHVKVWFWLELFHNLLSR